MRCRTALERAHAALERAWTFSRSRPSPTTHLKDPDPTRRYLVTIGPMPFGVIGPRSYRTSTPRIPSHPKSWKPTRTYETSASGELEDAFTQFRSKAPAGGADGVHYSMLRGCPMGVLVIIAGAMKRDCKSAWVGRTGLETVLLVSLLRLVYRLASAINAQGVRRPFKLRSKGGLPMFVVSKCCPKFEGLPNKATVLTTKLVRSRSAGGQACRTKGCELLDHSGTERVRRVLLHACS